MRRAEAAAALFLALAAPLGAAAGYDVNGVALGTSEAGVKARFPSAYCRPLEWPSFAADRRCDDSRAELDGVKVRVTFFLKADAVEGIELRFDMRDLERLREALRKRYGAPAAEGRERVEREGQPARELYRVLWREGGARAELSAEFDKRRASLLVSRGSFEEEIYRVR